MNSQEDAGPKRSQLRGRVRQHSCGSGTLSRGELDDLLIQWQRERCLPSANLAELVQMLLDALADHYDATPWPVRFIPSSP